MTAAIIRNGVPSRDRRKLLRSWHNRQTRLRERLERLSVWEAWAEALDRGRWSSGRLDPLVMAAHSTAEQLDAAQREIQRTAARTAVAGALSDGWGTVR
jgi:hypothetical protein